jgi:hypothetical protein
MRHAVPLNRVRLQGKHQQRRCARSRERPSNRDSGTTGLGQPVAGNCAPQPTTSSSGIHAMMIGWQHVSGSYAYYVSNDGACRRATDEFTASSGCGSQGASGGFTSMRGGRFKGCSQRSPKRRGGGTVHTTDARMRVGGFPSTPRPGYPGTRLARA